MSATTISQHPGLPPRSRDSGNDHVDANTLRATFALAMSAMYKAEVPLYGDLVRIVQNVNEHVRSREPSSTDGCGSPVYDSPQRLSLERHGAIRLGTPAELHTARRIFALLGMHPVGYYDLSVAGLPMHATCFRPITAAALEANPFRIFTTLLRPELLESSEARELSMQLLGRRHIFSNTLVDLIDTAETRQQGRLTHEQGELLVAEAIRSFSWQPVAAATHDEYVLLRAEHPILADIACFRSAHINHLTPRALDIVKAQETMIKEGLSVKDRIEGPPPRNCPVLLRQTSFLALEEAIRFPTTDASSEAATELVDGHHKARFGEIEERGAAVTPQGRKLYDQLLEEAMHLAAASETPSDVHTLDTMLAKTFAKYPDDWDELRRQRLVYCEYRCETGAREKLAALNVSGQATPSLLDTLVSEGVLTARPITYEDFLPFSAAGIFQSNLQSPPKGQEAASATGPQAAGQGDRQGYEAAMDCSALDAYDLYAGAQRRSLEKCAIELGLNIEDVSMLL